MEQFKWGGDNAILLDKFSCARAWLALRVIRIRQTYRANSSVVTVNS